MTFTEIIIKRMAGLIETANKDSAWEMEAVAEMMKATHLLHTFGPAQQPPHDFAPPDGWQMVPIEPTKEMIQACIWALDRWREKFGNVQGFVPPGEKYQVRWKAMLATAPNAPAVSSTTCCTCGGDLRQPASHHDISCPLAVTSTTRDTP